MKQIFVITLCVAVSGCVGPSNEPHSFDKGSENDNKANQKPQNDGTGIRISGEARFGVVYGN